MSKPDRHSIIPAVWVFIYNQNNEILLIRRFNTGWRDGWYTVPAGHMDGNESPRSAAARESKEEVGLDIDTANLEAIHTSIYQADSRDHERVSVFFKASNFSGNAHIAEPDKADELIWCKLNELPEKTVPILKHVLDMTKQGIAYSELNYPDSETQLPR
ncbi:MAG TPA: NUDIX domain-containing protein [Candidatus Saccharimonadales bacterium]